MQPISIKIKLHTLNCLKKAIGKKVKAEPYLRAIFFKLDGDTIRISDNFKLAGKADFHYAAESHGNLGIHHAFAGTLAIPPVIGEWRTTLTPLLIPYFEQYIPSIMGVMAIFVEQPDFISNDEQKSGDKALNRFVETTINKGIAAFDPRNIKIANIHESIQAFFQNKISELRDGVDDTIVEGLMTNQNFLQNLFGRISKDNIMGSYIWYFDQNEIAEKGKAGIDFGVPFTSPTHGEWEVLGNVKIIDHRPKIETPIEKKKDNNSIEPGRAPIPRQPTKTVPITPPKRQIEYIVIRDS